MPQKPKHLMLFVALTVVTLATAQGESKAGKSQRAAVESARTESAVLWREPTDIKTRNLYYGSGGKQHQPHGPFTFVEEDLNGTNPKYVVRDRDNVKWTVKIGMEARPETVASRFVWAAGYFTNEDYFLPELQVREMPVHVKRGQNQIGPDGWLHAARLKRHLADQKKIENWKWRDDPLTGTRELNGLKVLMALINNWDLKDENNALYRGKHASEEVYVVSDLGASFGTTGLSYPFGSSKGNLNSFVQSRFISKVSPEYVDFATPSRPDLIYVFKLPDFIHRVRMDGLVHHIPRTDARWIGHFLAHLSTKQIQDAFRAAGYNQTQVDAFSRVIMGRIVELNSL